MKYLSIMFSSLFPSPFRVSFLLINFFKKGLVKEILVSVSFRSSVLFYTQLYSNELEEIETFPSPFGVQFSFILPKLNPYFIVYYFIIFVRILEIFIFLLLNNKKYTLTPIFKVSWRLLKKIIIFVFNFI